VRINTFYIPGHVPEEVSDSRTNQTSVSDLHSNSIFETREMT